MFIFCSQFHFSFEIFIFSIKLSCGTYSAVAVQCDNISSIKWLSKKKIDLSYAKFIFQRGTVQNSNFHIVSDLLCVDQQASLQT